MICMLLFAGLFCAPMSGRTESRLFEEAVRAEATGDEWKAISIYEKISSSLHSANLHGNLAHLHAQKKSYGRAILNYRQALLLDPTNREFANNLDFTLRKAGVSPSSKGGSSYFGPDSMDAWIILTAIFFWTSAIACAFFYFSGWSKRKLIIPILLSSLGTIFLSFGIFYAHENRSSLMREMIALDPDSSEDNSSKKIPLRKIAISGTTANSKVSPGESLWIKFENRDSPELLKKSDGSTWVFAHTRNNEKKGWIKTNEIAPIIPGEFP